MFTYPLGGAPPPLTVGLVAAWDLDEDPFVDKLGNFDLTNVGGVETRAAGPNSAWVDGPAYARFRSTADSSLRVLSDDIPNGDRSWSFSTWGRMITNQDGILIGHVDIGGGGGDFNWYCQMNYSGNPIRLRVQDTTGSWSTTVESATYSTVIGTWYHVYGEYNADTRQVGISVNNETLVQSTFTVGRTPASNSGYTLTMGDWPGPTFELYGVMSATQLWGRVLTEAERTAVSAGMVYTDLADW